MSEVECVRNRKPAERSVAVSTTASTADIHVCMYISDDRGLAKLEGG